MINKIDLFNLEDEDSLPRTIIGNDGEINLEEFVRMRFSIPTGYKVRELRIKTGEVTEINSLIYHDIKVIRKAGYPENIYTPIYESILNAHQHGNKKDFKKKIIFAYRVEQKHLDVLVEDEGGTIDSIFIPFILRHREKDIKNKFVNFYEFSGREKPKTNNGTGTSFIHAYMDEVNYYLGENGLVIHMIKNKI